MTLRRILAIFFLLAAFIGGPLISTQDLAAGALVYVVCVGFAFAVALWPRDLEAAIDDAFARNFSDGDPH